MRTTFILLTLALLAGTATADRVTLVYGDVLEGQIVQETDTTITIRGPFGEQKLMRSDIKEIQVTGAPAGSGGQPSPPPAVEQPMLPPQQPVPQSPPPMAPPQAPPMVSPPVQDGPPSPYEILRKNVEVQSQWKDLEIAYLQRAYISGQTVQTQFIGRVIPPHFFRSKLTTPVPASPTFPQGGEVEYDMYRAKSMLYQVVKSPGQPVQYLKLDMSRVPGLQPGDNPVESYMNGFTGAGTDEVMLQSIARHSTIVGSENTDGHDCWVLETTNSPELVEVQVSRQSPEFQASMREQLSQLGYIRCWIGKEDMIQWRMENYSSVGDLLMSMKVISARSNQGLSAQDLRMKVPRGTEFIDVTDMVAGQFAQVVGGSPGIVPIPGPNDLMGAPQPQPYPPQPAPQAWPQGQAPAYPQTMPGQNLPPTFPQQAPGQQVWPPQPQTYENTAPAQPVAPAPQPMQPALPQVPQQNAFPDLPNQVQQGGMLSAPNPYSTGAPMAGYPAMPQQAQPAQAPMQYMSQPAQPMQPGYPTQPGYPMQQSYPMQGYPTQPGMQAPPSAYQQVYAQQGYPQQAQQQSGGVGGFLKNLFGGGGKSNQPNPALMGANQSGNQTLMVPVINGQPQFPGYNQ